MGGRGRKGGMEGRTDGIDRMDTTGRTAGWERQGGTQEARIEDHAWAGKTSER